MREMREMKEKETVHRSYTNLYLLFFFSSLLFLQRIREVGKQEDVHTRPLHLRRATHALRQGNLARDLDHPRNQLAQWWRDRYRGGNEKEREKERREREAFHLLFVNFEY